MFYYIKLYIKIDKKFFYLKSNILYYNIFLDRLHICHKDNKNNVQTNILNIC